MQEYEKLLLANKAWAADKVATDAEYFDVLSADQKPKFLWIGCADSRVPAEQVTGAQPGEIFVQRNIANLVVHTDMNLLSVLQYAVEVLKVKHVIVCGHYGCGGVKTAMMPSNLGLIDNWIRNIKDVYAKYRPELDAISEEPKRFDRLVELSVQEQIYNLAKTAIVQAAWNSEQRPILHGWVFDLRTGLIKDIVRLEPGAEIDPIYNYSFPNVVY
nr:carbonic anhydrase [uncultured Arsenicibacter sp.]